MCHNVQSSIIGATDFDGPPDTEEGYQAVNLLKQERQLYHYEPIVFHKGRLKELQSESHGGFALSAWMKPEFQYYSVKQIFTLAGKVEAFLHYAQRSGKHEQRCGLWMYKSNEALE